MTELTELQKAALKVAHLTTQPELLEMVTAEDKGTLNLTPREDMLLDVLDAVTDLAKLALDEIKELKK